MEILDCNAGLLTNFEVLSLLEEKCMECYDFEEHLTHNRTLRNAIDRGKKARQASANSDKGLTEKQKKHVAQAQVASHEQAVFRKLEQPCWMRSRMLEYLRECPAGRQDPTKLAAFLEGVEELQKSMNVELRLSQMELCQLVDLCPSTLVELHKVVEECEDRFLEVHTKTIIELVQEHLPQPEVEEDEGDEGDGGDVYDDPVVDDAADSGFLDAGGAVVDGDELADEQGAHNDDNNFDKDDD